jgi:hypothetical protein
MEVDLLEPERVTEDPSRRSRSAERPGHHRHGPSSAEHGVQELFAVPIGLGAMDGVAAKGVFVQGHAAPPEVNRV